MKTLFAVIIIAAFVVYGAWWFYQMGFEDGRASELDKEYERLRKS